MLYYNFIIESTISELVKDSEWQQLRNSLVGTWKKTPEKNCLLLKKYLGNLKNTTDSRLKIVWNYLSSSAFRIGIIKHNCVADLKNKIRNEILKRGISFR